MSISEKITPGEWVVKTHNYKVGPALERSVLVLTNGKKEIVTKACNLGEFGGINEEDDYNFQSFAKVPEMLSILERLAKNCDEETIFNITEDTIKLLDELNKSV